MKTFYLPDLGEGLPDAEIHEWHVKVGDKVETDQLLVSMETAKAVVEVPSPCNGEIAKLCGDAGDVIDTGSPLVEFVQAAESSDTEEKINKPSGAATVAGNIEIGDTVIEESATGITVNQQASGRAKALPAVRSLAKHLHVDLNTLTGSGTNGEITAEDVKAASQLVTSKPAKPSILPPVELNNPEKLRGTRRSMAQIMTASHEQVVPVTLVDDADIHAWPKETDITLRLLRAIVRANKIEPALNGFFDGENLARELCQEVHLGLAMDSADGLFVPVVKNVEKHSDEELRGTIERFKQQVTDRTIPAGDLQGATISLSNFGTFSGRYANPIVVPPCITIIGCGRARSVVVDEGEGQFAAHRILPLSVSFDHRAATGGEASRFLAAMLKDLALEG